MGMFDYVIAPPVQCPCGDTIKSWQSKDARCNLERLKPKDVNHYYAFCDKCGRWHSFCREGSRNTGAFIYRVAEPSDRKANS